MNEHYQLRKAHFQFDKTIRDSDDANNRNASVIGLVIVSFTFFSEKLHCKQLMALNGTLLKNWSICHI